MSVQFLEPSEFFETSEHARTYLNLVEPAAAANAANPTRTEVGRHVDYVRKLGMRRGKLSLSFVVHASCYWSNNMC
jgi:hypothetical protein